MARTTHRSLAVVLALSAGFCLTRAAHSQTPLGTAFTYQGQLRSGGAPVAGACDFQFSLWDAADGGTPVGTMVSVDDHPVADGLFTVSLDFGAAAFLGDARWLEIAVRDGASTGGYTTLAPRQPVTATPYALCALKALEADAVPWAGLSGVPADLLDGDDDTTYSAGEGLILAGTEFSVSFGGSGFAVTASRSDHDHFGASWSGSAPTGLEVVNDSDANETTAIVGRATSPTNNAGTYGVYGESDSEYGAGVYGYAKDFYSFGRGVYGVTEAREGCGVYGRALATTGDADGVFGRSKSPYGHGVYGFAEATTGDPSGVFGRNDGTGGYGVYGTSPVRGVYGFAHADTGVTYGVYGKSESTSGRGVTGEATAASGITYGVRGESASTSGRGVYGYTSATSGTTYAVLGYCWSSAGYDFYASGGGTDYGPFTGGHEVRLDPHFPADPKPGLIVSATGRTERRTTPDGRVGLSSTLPTVALACKANDKAVLGVLVAENTLPEDHWYTAQSGERFGVANALGEGRVWVCDANGPIEAGDYITTSAVPGYGRKQPDDLLHNYTLGKAIETIDWDAVSETIEVGGRKVKVYLLAVVYTSG